MFRGVDLIRLIYFMCSTLVLPHGFKNDVACLFRLMAERPTDVTSVARLFRLMAKND